MVNLFSRKKDHISVSVLEDTLFLHPPATRASPTPSTSQEFANLEPTHDPILRGQVTLVCAAPRKARRIRVDLVGRVTRHGGDGSHNYESSVSLEKHLEIDLHGERLDRGTHTCVPRPLFSSRRLYRFRPGLTLDEPSRPAATTSALSFRARQPSASVPTLALSGIKVRAAFDAGSRFPPRR